MKSYIVYVDLRVWKGHSSGQSFKIVGFTLNLFLSSTFIQAIINESCSGWLDGLFCFEIHGFICWSDAHQ
jgi:hypothetical protein